MSGINSWTVSTVIERALILILTRNRIEMWQNLQLTRRSQPWNFLFFCLSETNRVFSVQPWCDRLLLLSPWLNCVSYLFIYQFNDSLTCALLIRPLYCIYFDMNLMQSVPRPPVELLPFSRTESHEWIVSCRLLCSALGQVGRVSQTMGGG